MKYSRYKVGDRVELVNIDFLQKEEDKIVSGINAGVHTKQFIPILRGAKEFKKLEWNSVEIDYLLVEITRIRSITATNPIIAATVIHSSGKISEEIVPGDQMYIHEDLREFVTDPIVSRYIWSNYIIDPNKPVLDYGVWCLSDYNYIEKMFRSHLLRGIERAKITKRLIREAMEEKRLTYDTGWVFSSELQSYRKILDDLLLQFKRDIRVLTFNFTLDDYDDFVDDGISKIGKLLNISMKSMSRITITDNRIETDAIPVVSYSVVVIMHNSDYMSLSQDLTPKRNEIFRAINNEINYHLNHTQSPRSRFFIENMSTEHIEDESQFNLAIASLMRFLFF